MGYIKTIFRINSEYRPYSGDSGSWSDEAKNTFVQESRSAFMRMGWDIKAGNSSGCCDSAIRGRESLYLHPLLFEGVILEESIPVIEKALSCTQSFRWCHTDTYARYLEMSDSEYLLHLSSEREEIIQDILQGYQTKRRNLFITSDGVLEKVKKKYHVHRVGDRDTSDAILSGVLDNLFSMLLARGDLVESLTRNGTGYRTATEKDKKEQKTA